LPSIHAGKSGLDAVPSKEPDAQAAPLGMARQKAHTDEAHSKRRETFQKARDTRREQARELKQQGLVDAAIKEASAVAHLLDLLDSTADEPAS